jgi:hypothetical protein
MTDPRCFIEFRPGMRRLIEDAIESLILLLDEIDGDGELEDDDIEQDDPPRTRLLRLSSRSWIAIHDGPEKAGRDNPGVPSDYG